MDNLQCCEFMSLYIIDDYRNNLRTGTKRGIQSAKMIDFFTLVNVRAWFSNKTSRHVVWKQIKRTQLTVDAYIHGRSIFHVDGAFGEFGGCLNRCLQKFPLNVTYEIKTTTTNKTTNNYKKKNTLKSIQTNFIYRF